jgi:hypothetical protein
MPLKEPSSSSTELTLTCQRAGEAARERPTISTSNVHRGPLSQLLEQREQLGSLGRDNVEQRLARVLCPREAVSSAKRPLTSRHLEFVIEDPNPDGALGEQLLQLVGRRRA